MDLGLAGRHCFVTGASTGIGRGTALALAAEGALILPSMSLRNRLGKPSSRQGSTNRHLIRARTSDYASLPARNGPYYFSCDAGPKHLDREGPCDRRRAIRAHGRHRRYAKSSRRVAGPSGACQYAFISRDVGAKGDRSPVTTSHTIESLRFRMVTHITSSLAHEVGDVDDHTLSLSTFSGLAFFADGVVAKSSFTPSQTTWPEPALSRSTPLSASTMIRCCSSKRPARAQSMKPGPTSPARSR